MIQWYPGHMTKARRNIQEHLKLVDLVIELLDARVPSSSQNPDITAIATGKKHIIVLNKADLAHPEATDEWIRYFREKGLVAVPIDSQRGTGLKLLNRAIRELLSDRLDYWKSRGRKPRAFRAMVLGIPNVGKSSLINRFARRKSAKTGDKPGITKGMQWIRFSTDLELLDVPGILWPKFEDKETGYKLAITGAIASHLFDPIEMVKQLLFFLPSDSKERILNMYQITDQGQENLDLILLSSFGRTRGYLLPGGEIDLTKSATNLLADFQKGRFGRISLELPGEA